MSVIATARPVWERFKATVSGSTDGGDLKGVSFYVGPVVSVNLSFPAIIVMERSITLVEEAYTWGVAELRVRLDVLSAYPDPSQNLEELERIADRLLDLFWNDRQLGGEARDTRVGEVVIGEVEERPEHISASLALTFTFEFERPV